MKLPGKNTYGLLLRFGGLILLLSFVVRLALLIRAWPDAGMSFGSFFRVFGYGLLFDLAWPSSSAFPTRCTWH